MAFLTQVNTFTSDFLPKRFGLKFDPPTIVLEYLVPSTGKLYHHKMKLRNLAPDDDPEEVLEYLKQKHSTYVNTPKVSDDQILNLISKLQDRMLEEEDGELNKLSRDELQKRKDRPSTLYRENTEQGYIHDLRKNLIPSESSEWDSSDEDCIRL